MIILVYPFINNWDGLYFRDRPSENFPFRSSHIGGFATADLRNYSFKCLGGRHHNFIRKNNNIWLSSQSHMYKDEYTIASDRIFSNLRLEKLGNFYIK